MAGKRIAGITIEIGGDTTKLQSSLKKVDKQLSTTKSTLKDVDKLLKLKPGNTNLLIQKQKNLQNAISGTKDRLDELKKAQTDALSPDEYDALQREIIETENELDNLEKAYKDFGSVGKQKLIAVGDTLKSVGGKVANVGKSLTKYVTGPIVAAGAAAYAAFTEVDEGMDTLILKTGATGDTLEEMGEIMKNIATSIPTDFATAGEAVGEVNTRFALQGKELEKLSAKYVKFAQINGTDVTSAVDSTQKALAAFGLGAESAGDYLDYLTYTAQRTGIDVNTLSSGVIANAAAFQELGMSIFGATEFMGDLELSGVDVNTVMSGLSKALKAAAAEGVPLDQALANLQDTILGNKDGTDGLTEAYKLFGKNGAQIYAAVKNGTLDFRNLGTTVAEVGGTVEKTFDATLDPADDFKVALNELKVLGAEIADLVMPALTKILTKVRDVLKDLRARWDSLSDSQKKNILKIVGVVAAIGPMLVVLGKVLSSLGSIITLMTGPAGIVVAIGAVVAAGIWLIAHWDEVKEKAKEIWDKIVGFFKGAWEKIKAIDWAGVGKFIWECISAPFVAVGQWFKDKFDKVKDAIANIDWAALGTAIWDKIKGAFSSIGQWFSDIFTSAVNGVFRLLNGMIGGTEHAINRIIRGINKGLTINVDFGSVPDWVPGIGGKSLGGIHWKPGIKGVTFKRLEYLANGGILREGGQAIVGEDAPEYLRVINGRAIVTPIPNAARGDGSYTFNVYAQPGQSAQQIAQEVQRIMVREQRQRSAAYA